MKFEEWFAGLVVPPPAEHYKAMAQAWEGALTFGLKPKAGDVTLNEAVKLLQGHGFPPAVSDHWLVKVRGGHHVSEVVIDSVDATYVWVSDPPKTRFVRGQRRHKIEDLEFIQLLCRGLK